MESGGSGTGVSGFGLPAYGSAAAKAMREDIRRRERKRFHDACVALGISSYVSRLPTWPAGDAPGQIDMSTPEPASGSPRSAFETVEAVEA